MKDYITKKLNTNRILIIMITLVFVASSIGLGNKINAQSVGDLREETEKLQEDIEKNEEAADEKHRHAESLKEMVGEIEGDIASTEQQIQTTAGTIDKLNNDLKQKQKELDKAKDLLKLNMSALYKRGDASTVELIVGSDSFSEFMDEQEYLERIKVGIEDSANEVIRIKDEIKSKRDKRKEELAKQEVAKEALANTRAKKAELLEETRGQEQLFREKVEELEEKREEVDKQLTALIIAARQKKTNHGTVSGDGQVIGRVGSTGFSTGPHLHFEMRNSNGQVVNPNGTMGAWPVSGSLSQGYGCVAPYSWYYVKCGNGKSLHPGLDIVAAYGAPVVATKPGTIIFKGWDGAYGNKVVVAHNDGTYSVYAHLSSF